MRLRRYRRRQRGNRRVRDLDVVSSGIAARRALTQHPRQRLPAGVIAVRIQQMMPEPLEVRFREFLVRVREGHGGIQPDAGHTCQHLIRDPHPGQLPVPRHRLPPGVPARRVRCGSQLPRRPRAALCDLLQRPVRRRHRRDLPERLLLISQHPEITDRPGTISDHA